MDEYPVVVEGEWASFQANAIKNKLQIYFQSKKKSDGGDCRVEVTGDHSVRATVYFKCDEVKKRVLARDDHEIIIEKASIKLHLSLPASTNDDTEKLSKQTPPNVDNVTDLVKDPVDADDGCGLRGSRESAYGVSLVLENIPEHMNRDVVSLLVETVSRLDEESFSLEIIWETKKAVVTLNNPSAVDRFLQASLGNEKFKRYGMAARQLEGAQTVRVENLTPVVIKDMLELYFEKNWTLPVSISMIPEENAAVATFNDPKVAETISKIEDHIICKVPVKVYPFYESLGSALYGKDRPTWKMPEAFTESVHPPVWKFLLMKKQLKAINQQMCSYFCSVELETPEAKLSPLLKQKGLTARQVDEWKSNASQAFRELLSQYTAFDCLVNISAWKMVEKEIRSVVREDAELVLNAPKEMLTVAGRAEDVNRIRGPVEDIILNAVRQMERQRDSVSEAMDMCPAKYYILQQEGLLKAASDISQELHLSYQDPAKKLTISGLEAEVSKVKCWILERELRMYKKPLDDVDPCILDFLKSVDAMEMSQELFTSLGTNAIYSMDGSRVFLTGSSENALVLAERKIRSVFSMQSLHVQDEKVVRMPEWMKLNTQLLETYNSSKMKTVLINLQPERRGTITVSGFLNPVQEVARSLEEFIVNYSQVEETIRIKSNAVVQFLQERKRPEWTSFAMTNEVRIHFDPSRPRIKISGARLHVQKSKGSLQSLMAALCTDAHTVDKPGAKKYFLSQENKFLALMRDVDCVVVLQKDKEEYDEDEDDNEEEGRVEGSIYCEVQTASGVLVSVSKTDICSFRVDAVVNAANEDLKHIGGVAHALSKAAGPQLQKLSDDYIARNGRLRPGDAIVTDACKLPCKYVVHAVGPRFSDSDRKTAVSQLNLAIQESLRQAAMNNCSSIAVPAVSSGVFGFPLELCAETIAQAVRQYCNTEKAPGLLTEIHLTDNNDQTVRALAKAVNNEFKDLQPKMTLPRQGSSRQAGYSISAHHGQGQWGPRGPPNPTGQLRFGAEDRGRLDHETTHTQEGLKICLRKGNIQDQATDVIVNTISGTLDLDSGGVSKAILEAAGPRLQFAVKEEDPVSDVIVTAGFNLKCQKVFHTICPHWDYGAGQSEEKLKSIIRYCLEEAEKLRMASVSFPAIGTGNMRFPKSLVSRTLLEEIHVYSQRRNPQYLREVAVVLHPSDTQTVDSFTTEFKGQKQGNHQGTTYAFDQSSRSQSTVQSKQTTASFSQVSSPSLGVYQMKMGQLNLEVSSGDITKDTSDVIINSSNQGFNLKMGVSKAILDSAGLQVELECSTIVNSPSYQPSSMILTSAGSLPSRHILHIIGQSDPAKIKDVVYSVLRFCEEQKFTSVAFPALGTGQGRASPTAVADAMIDAVVEFVRKKHQRCVHSVKILVFQTAMMKEFLNSMRRREGQDVEEKSGFTKLMAKVTSFFGGSNEERPTSNSLTLEREEFEPAVFQLCAESSQALGLAKKTIEELIVAEQYKRTISDPFIRHLSKGDMDQLSALQRKLTVSIHLERVQGKEEEACIHLEGLTRDVVSAESDIRDLIRNAERTENRRQKAILASELVKWQYQDQQSLPTPFDIFTNYELEEALALKKIVKIKINNQDYTADVQRMKASKTQGHGHMELIRKEQKDETDLPANWEDMTGSLLTVRVRQGSKEYSDVESACTKTGLSIKISRIERVQNKTLWQSYQLMKKRLEEKNQHTNNEMLLFHGTSSTSIDFINSQGFNRSYAGAHGAMYGNGSYFAVDPKYSAGNYAKPDSSGKRRMYLARVLVGDFTRGAGGMIVPPQKGTGNTADLYDSVTDNPASPTMFVVFTDTSAYPEYLITFT